MLLSEHLAVNVARLLLSSKKVYFGNIERVFPTIPDTGLRFVMVLGRSRIVSCRDPYPLA